MHSSLLRFDQPSFFSPQQQASADDEENRQVLKADSSHLVVGLPSTVNEQLDVFRKVFGDFRNHVAFEKGKHFVAVRRAEHEDIDA